MKRKLKATPIAMFIFKDIDKLEHDPVSQYKFNRNAALIWLVTMIGVPFVGNLYDHNISALIITEVSLWANLATHFGAMSGALAAMNTTKKIDNIDNTVDGVGDIFGVE
jgi:hypothetical protein